MKRPYLIPLVAGIATPAFALPPMPAPGLNGVIDVGFESGQMETSFLARLDGFQVDLSNERINGTGSPESEDIYVPLASGELGWTFGNEHTRVSVANEYTDVLQWDRQTRASIRHDFDNLGEIRLDGLFFWGFATQVWRDPYALGVKRNRTDQETRGGRFIWDDIFRTGFGIDVMYKDREINNDQSGAQLGLDEADRALLSREGDIYEAELNYTYEVDAWHSITPAIGYIERDLDGGAMAQDGIVVGLDHAYVSRGLEWVSTVAYTYLEGDEENPLFNETNDADGWTLQSEASFPGMLESSLGEFVPKVFVTWAEEDSDIDFNDTSIWTLGFGVELRL